jgi:1-acyl-sn-glycerol-3-phosphate acyltransferase
MHSVSGLFRALIRLPGVIFQLLRGYFLMKKNTQFWSDAERARQVQQWAQGMLDAMGVQIFTTGQPAQGPAMWIANHISWLDILAIHSVGHCRFVSKAEVHHWPVIGVLAEGAGTLFIERQSSRDAMRVVHQMTQALAEGDIVAVFPEGTTSNGESILNFHANLLQAAISAQANVQPILLTYIEQGQLAQQVPYINDDTLLASIWRILKAAEIQAHVQFNLPCQPNQQIHRREWALQLQLNLKTIQQKTFSQLIKKYP